MMFNKDQDYWASCYSTNEFLLIETYSGLGKTRRDPIYNPHILSLDADDKCIGKDVLRALLNSRTLTSLDERVTFFDLEKGKQQYVIWIAMLMEKYGYIFLNKTGCGENEIYCVFPDLKDPAPESIGFEYVKLAILLEQ
ncbi:contact-dependent growth inhibition system immunity protein [Photorhabdus sp. RM323S]|uniref:contact-dependent growth inhibition system immunity protein n=1 Tax=Photorhabdus sp. RM323S TaxID=3342828 RepID=UPI0036DBC2E1